MLTQRHFHRVLQVFWNRKTVANKTSGIGENKMSMGIIKLQGNTDERF